MMKTVIKVVVTSLICWFMAGTACAEGYFSRETMRESITHKNPEIKYRPGVLVVGKTRAEVLRAFGPANGTDQHPNFTIEDVYIFLKDGSKYVNPAPRPRNVALGIATGGISVAVRQARLAYQRTELSVFHVFYNPQQKITRVTVEQGSAFKIPYTTSK